MKCGGATFAAEYLGDFLQGGPPLRKPRFALAATASTVTAEDSSNSSVAVSDTEGPTLGHLPSLAGGKTPVTATENIEVPPDLLTGDV